MSLNLSIHDILISPVVTEKSIGLTSISPKYGKYTFLVHQDADKNMVKKAVEKIFNTEVNKINMRNMPGKVKYFQRRYKGFRSGSKKAEVTVANAIGGTAGTDYGLGDAYGS